MSPLNEDDREALTAYLDGELDDEATQALEARLSHEPDLRAELDSLRETWGLLDFLPTAPPSPDFTHRTLDRLSLEGRTTKTASVPGQRRRRVFGWTAAGLAALLLGTAGGGLARHYLGRPVDPDESIVRDLRLLERFRDYGEIEDMEFLKGLDHPDLFGEEGT